jgi:hypothetical protein
MSARSTTAVEPLWGIGTYEGPAGRVAWEISHTEIQRDMAAAGRTLAGMGVGAGTRVLICSMLAEAGQFWPFTVGAMMTGAQLSCADANAGDAMRVAMFTRLVEYRAVLGVTGAILDGLDALGREYGDVFGAVAYLGARPDAYPRLAAAGLRPSHFVLCGPAVAVGCEPGAAAIPDGEEWDLDIEAGRVVVSNRRPRATNFVRTETAVHGELHDGGLVPAMPKKEEGR